MKSRPKYSVHATERSFKIIEFLKENDGAGVTETAQALGMSKGVVHNHLKTLEAAEYVVQEEEQYRLSFRFLELGEYQRIQTRLYTVGKEQVDELSAETGEQANLAIEEHGRCVYLYISRGNRAVGVDSYAGLRPNLHLTALGKAILAHYPRSKVESILDTHGMEGVTEHSVTDRETLYNELETILDRGIAFDSEERLPGLSCVAAPILTNDGDVTGAISVSGPKTRLGGDPFEEQLLDAVRSAANVIELNLEYSD